MRWLAWLEVEATDMVDTWSLDSRDAVIIIVSTRTPKVRGVLIVLYLK